MDIRDSVMRGEFLSNIFSRIIAWTTMCKCKQNRFRRILCECVCRKRVKYRDESRIKEGGKVTLTRDYPSLALSWRTPKPRFPFVFILHRNLISCTHVSRASKTIAHRSTGNTKQSKLENRQCAVCAYQKRPCWMRRD